MYYNKRVPALSSRHPKSYPSIKKNQIRKPMTIRTIKPIITVPVERLKSLPKSLKIPPIREKIVSIILEVLLTCCRDLLLSTTGIFSTKK